MKHIYTAAAGLLLCAGLVSCELKEELSGSSSSSETGYLDLSVAVNASLNVMTRSDVTYVGTNTSSVSADDFPVVITGVTDETYEKSFASYAALVEENPIELPVGEYTVTAHSNLTLATQMTEPYYAGETESNLTITKDVTSSATVTCTMENMRIQLYYSSDFTANFTKWEITITDGASILTFTDDDGENPNPVYWLVADNVSELTATINATDSNGTSTTKSVTLTKPTGSSSDYWTGGDALTITMDLGEDEDGNGDDNDDDDGEKEEQGGANIEVSADVTFEDSEESVEVSVTVTENNDNTGDNTSSTSNALSITLPYEGAITYSISAGNAPSSADVVINAEAGIKSLNVKISSSNASFDETLVDLVESGLDFVSDGVEIVGNELIGAVLSLFGGEGVEIPTLSAGDSDYTFPIASFFSLMEMYGTGAHTFSISLEDMDGNTLDKSLTVTITD